MALFFPAFRFFPLSVISFSIFMSLLFLSPYFLFSSKVLHFCLLFLFLNATPSHSCSLINLCQSRAHTHTVHSTLTILLSLPLSPFPSLLCPASNTVSPLQSTLQQQCIYYRYCGKNQQGEWERSLLIHRFCSFRLNKDIRDTEPVKRRLSIMHLMIILHPLVSLSILSSSSLFTTSFWNILLTPTS